MVSAFSHIQCHSTVTSSQAPKIRQSMHQSLQQELSLQSFANSKVTELQTLPVKKIPGTKASDLKGWSDGQPNGFLMFGNAFKRVFRHPLSHRVTHGDSSSQMQAFVQHARRL